MSGTTTNYALPYPDETDAADPAADIKALAQDADSALHGAVTPADPALSLTPGTSWAVTTFTAHKAGAVASIYAKLTYSGSTLTAGSGGNLPDTQCATLPAGLLPLDIVVPTFDKGGIATGSAYIQTGGAVFLKTVSPTASINSGDTVEIGVTYMTG